MFFENSEPIIEMENKMMATTTPPIRRPSDSVCLNVAEHDRNKAPENLKRKKIHIRPAYFVNGIIIIIVSLIVGLTEFGFLPQTKRGFYCKDPSLSFPYQGDTISNTLLLSVSFAGSCILLALVEYLRLGSKTKLVLEVSWRWYRDMLVGMVLTLLVIEVCKVIAGEMRPHFLDTCVPDVAASCTPGTFITDYVCTSTVYSRTLIVDSSRSFPSGHSALGMFVSVFLAAYIQVRLPTHTIGSLSKPFLIAVVFIWGPLCALTRITDRRHHWWDVLFGTIFGVVGALYSVVVLCSSFKNIGKTNMKSTRPSQSTTTLLDIKNKDATSVII
ncbi:PREDICTED: uncharacterized protein T28D9.3-like isoform X2 [Nicrophorus vespilloides]|uniref:Uncharacterized protein T28D9.3-like isoform X2 n=1 Tax=Nicrophorus vespilloides TaxID=110193 RepID=A0ABM1MQK4_NICVS|nr:PREDICTED: uncharacterized protein T28D9.3-like isoform X2 [Nicrophorus vespilloides]